MLHNGLAVRAVLGDELQFRAFLLGVGGKAVGREGVGDGVELVDAVTDAVTCKIIRE